MELSDLSPDGILTTSPCLLDAGIWQDQERGPSLYTYWRAYRFSWLAYYPKRLFLSVCTCVGVVSIGLRCPIKTINCKNFCSAYKLYS